MLSLRLENGFFCNWDHQKPNFCWKVKKLEVFFEKLHITQTFKRGPFRRLVHIENPLKSEGLLFDQLIF